MPLESFEALIQHPAPGFACVASSDEAEHEAFVAAVAHIANPPADLHALRTIPQIRGAAAARTFYQSHDGGLLYTAKGCMAASGGPDEGIEIFRLDEWGERTTASVEFWNEYNFPDEELPYGRNDFVAIAHSRGAWTYIHWVIRGPNAGKVYWWASTMPPEVDDPPLAENFEEFIELICTQPVYFLNELLFCYTRYSDHKTSTQWIPNRYMADREIE